MPNDSQDLRFGKIVAFCGTRGVPAHYGGFETAVDEISRRFVDAGYSCDVFCRHSSSQNRAMMHQGRNLIYTSGSTHRKLDTLVSSIQTGYYLWRHRKRYTHVYWFNNANLPGILLTKLARIPLTVNTDGLEWRRDKWSWPFKIYYYISSMLICIVCKSLVTDSRALELFYRRRFFKKTNFIPYGAPAPESISEKSQHEILKSLNLESGKYFLQITRIEPDNLPLEIAKAFVSSELGRKEFKLIIVGYKDLTGYVQQLIAYDGSFGIQIQKACYDKEILYTLRKNCFCYVHGNSVGGTNPALLEAMAFCLRILAINSNFSHEVLDKTGMYFDKNKIEESLLIAVSSAVSGKAMSARVMALYQWDAVAESYMRMANNEPAAYAPR